MTTSADVPAPSGSHPPARPSFLHKAGALYLDLALSALLSWDLGTSVGARAVLFGPLTAVIFTGIRLWFRDRIAPTPGEALTGIRYLTSKSSQVIAEIQVLDPRSRMGSVLLAAGIVESTLAFLGLAAWTVLDKAVFLGRIVAGPIAFGVLLAGAALQLTSAFRIMSGTRTALTWVPAMHLLLLLGVAPFPGAWREALPDGSEPFLGPFLFLYVSWSVLLTLVLILRRSALRERPDR